MNRKPIMNNDRFWGDVANLLNLRNVYRKNPTKASQMKVMLCKTLTEQEHRVRIRRSYRDLLEKKYPINTARRAIEVLYEAYLEVNRGSMVDVG